MSTTTAKPNVRKSKRNPERTREAILEVAGKLLAKDGPEGLSVSQVAQLAGVNRGTAYHHFQTRDQLLEATKTWVSEKLCKAVFGDEALTSKQASEMDPHTVAENLTNFAMENPEYGRIWLFEVLSSDKPGSDPFFHLYKTGVDQFVKSDWAQPGIDSEVHAVMMLVSVFLWPVWARSHTSTAAGRKKMANRFNDEVMRMGLQGFFNKDKFPDKPKKTKSTSTRSRKSAK